MKYAVLNLLFSAVLILVVILYTKQKVNKALLITLLIVLVLTALFDSLIVFSGIVAYNPDAILGVYIWKAPIEDFAYAIVSVVLVSLLWEYHERKK